jgi:hypothetical protein
MKQSSFRGAPLLFGLGLLLAFLPLQAGRAEAASKLPSLSSLVPGPSWAELSTAGKIVRVGDGQTGPLLMPLYQGNGDFRKALATERPKLLVESLYLFKRPRPADAGLELRGLYATILSTSSLQGIEYYSASRKKMRTFYSESWRIDGPETKQRLPDATVAPGPLPAAETFFAYQRDLTFGPNLYRCSYRSYPEAVSLESINLTSLTYLGIPVMAPDGLRIRLLIVQGEEGILFYVVNSADVPSLPIIRAKVEESITNRTEALFKWFEARQKK